MVGFWKYRRCHVSLPRTYILRNRAAVEFLLWLRGLRTWLVSWGCRFDPWPLSVGWGSNVAMICAVGCRCDSDPPLLWLWCRMAAVALIQTLAWELPNAMGAALKSKKKKKEIRQHYIPEVLAVHSRTWNLKGCSVSSVEICGGILFCPRVDYQNLFPTFRKKVLLNGLRQKTINSASKILPEWRLTQLEKDTWTTFYV